MELQVYRLDGSESGRTVTLDPTVFEIEPNDHVLWLDVKRIEANRRQGTHKVKNRAENAHSTRKLYRQKGTGYARAGDAKSPIRRGGGTAHGPQPRSYELKVNRKTQRLARRSALTYKAQAEAIRVVEDFTFEQPSTRRLLEVLAAQGLADRKVLLLTGEYNPALYLSSRNLPKVRVLEARNASTRDLLDAQVLLMQESAVEVLNRMLRTAPVAA
ncbi:50S ribosomal protein L4 [Rhodothermus marinus]|uniref:Large ribosomal subunit protein uL4 n=1 Tax=Rhodothermus marinus (strain ATCC 43812 / DSM 4252 / R-10) TaxID=518766 RepID=D0MGV5_RHOM4|nr:50S ribosomal protein L4 [Rhodothermus marinus]ACY47740.1 ribosomal protein L4/L1e [Rhodothermus marinus DSM 4252]AEN73942.1 ribosomal protein L4/L1e [Rhodothermus marinus SG0.5JP17-172]MBO2492494.1 50S ribosomal protein L4 [Rhodothermus marinus]